MGMHGGGMAEGTHMMWGSPGMMVFGLLYVLAVVFFLWMVYRGVVALEEIAENTEE